MRNYGSDDRTRLLLSARVVNGVKITVSNEHDRQVMQQMVKEGLFTYSNMMFSEGYWWTPAGERAAEKAWRKLPVIRFPTRYRNNPRVKIALNGDKEETCHVSGLWVRESIGGRWLVDHPNGEQNVRFNSADEAIEWALKQEVGKRRR